MSEEVLQALNEVLYYVDEYKKGNPEVSEEEMRIIAKQVKGLLNGSKIHFLYYKLLMSYIKIRIALVSYQTIQDERFADISNQYMIDIYSYLEYTDFLRNYIKESIKNKDYSQLDDAFVLSVKLEEMMQSLKLYTDDLYKILKENTASYIACYPKNDYTESIQRKNEIETIVKKLKKDPE